MVAIPFIYFSCLFIFIYKKKGFDLSTYLVLIYVIISFFSILIDIFDYRYFNAKYYEISLEATVVYCFLLTLTFYPFYLIDFNRVKSVKLINTFFFNIVIYLFVFGFIYIAINSIEGVYKILSGDLGELRRLQYKGEKAYEINSKGLLYIISNIIGSSSTVMILFYFYSICFLKKPKWFNLLILLSSFSIVIIGIIGVDRSKTFYWIITYGAMLVLFWPYLKIKQRKNIKLISIIILSLLLSYFIAMTISRFGDRSEGTEGGIIAYAGQSFIHFCMFYDTINYPDYTLQRILPLSYNLFVDNGIGSSVELNEDITKKTGVFVGIFSTFLGDILVSSNLFTTFIFVLIYFSSARIFINLKTKVIYFHSLLILYLYYTIPLLGIFVYYQSNYIRSYGIIFLILYIMFMIFIKNSQKK